jgi:Tfp pilus assembly protein PilF
MINYLQQQDLAAEKNLRKALRLDPTLASSHYQLARVYQREGKFKEALAEIDAAGSTRKVRASIICADNCSKG